MTILTGVLNWGGNLLKTVPDPHSVELLDPDLIKLHPDFEEIFSGTLGIRIQKF
jgi:hypothetical protein